MLFPSVALLASRDYVAFGAFSTASYWDNMIHRQGTWRKSFAAIMAQPRRAPPLPPLAGTKFPCPLPFAADLFLAHGYCESAGVHRFIYTNA